MVSAHATLNAYLNGACTLLLLAGYCFIRAKRITAHRLCMLSAFVVSCVFLFSYLYYHYQAGSVRFTGQGPIRFVYFLILISHTVLAAAIVPLILKTLWLAWKGNFERHRLWARWAFPIWVYVSVTGVVIYRMLYG